MTRRELAVASALTVTLAPAVLVAALDAWLRWERRDAMRCARMRGAT